MINSFFKIYNLLNKIQKKNLFLVFFGSLILMILEIFSVSLILPVLYYFSDGNNTANNFIIFIDEIINYFDLNKYNIFFISLIIFILFYFIKIIYNLLFIWFNLGFLYKLKGSISSEVFKKYFSFKYSFFLNQNSATLIRNVRDEVDQSIMGFLSNTLVFLREALIIFGIIVLVIIYDPLSFLIFVITIVPITLIYVLIIKNKIQMWGAQRQKFESKRYKNLLEGFNGIRDIKIMGAENFFMSNYLINTIKTNYFFRLHSFFQQLPRIVLEFVFLTSIIFIIVLFNFRSFTQSEIISSLGFFSLCALKILPSVAKLISSFQILNFNKPAVKKVNEIFTEFELNSSSKQNNIINTTFNFENFSNIKLENLSYNYPNSNKKIFDNLNLVIKKNECIGLVGKSGIGKTTLVNLITCVLEPTKGNVIVDKIDVTSNSRSWQNIIGYVPQDIYLIDESIRDNIVFNLDNNLADDMRLKKSIKESNLEEFVYNLPDGLDTQIGEKGLKLSGGQRQRIGIARALYKSPKLLIFDEATNSLDKNNEKEILNNIKKIKDNFTVLIISHNEETLSFCDKIISIKNNKISFN